MASTGSTASILSFSNVARGMHTERTLLSSLLPVREFRNSVRQCTYTVLKGNADNTSRVLAR